MTKRLLLLFAICCLLTPLAWADLYVNNLPVNTYGGYYVGPAGASWQSKAAGWEFDIICNDFSSTTYVPSSFPVIVSDFNDLSNTRFIAQGGLKYQQAAWLVNQMYANMGNGTAVGQIQYAIWELFNSTKTPDNYGGWYAAALAADLTNYDFSAFRILTPTGSGASNQEFITRVPEPFGGIILMAGVLGIGLCYRRRRSQTV